jgi:hypothetical protein
MVQCCVNPACREEFKLLSAGDLYAHERRSADTEFFWLCAACAGKFDLYLDPAGRVMVRAWSAGNRAVPPHPEGDLRLVSRLTKRVPQISTILYGERTGFFPPDFSSSRWSLRVRDDIERRSA